MTRSRGTLNHRTGTASRALSHPRKLLRSYPVVPTPRCAGQSGERRRGGRSGGLLSLRGAKRRGNPHEGAQPAGDCFATVAMTATSGRAHCFTRLPCPVASAILIMARRRCLTVMAVPRLDPGIRPGHPSQHGAGGNGRVKPGHDDEGAHPGHNENSCHRVDALDLCFGSCNGPLA